MGVDFELFERLVDLSTRFRPEGRTLMLGRQAFRLNQKIIHKYDAVLANHGYDLTHEDVVQDDGFSETLMRKLGFGEIESMDFSDYEQAGIVHDLNRPVDDALEQEFGFILDGGTIEHVFNVPMALENVFRMLKVGGWFVSANGLNGWPSHGIYQFTPELVWTYWIRNCGCAVHDCRGIHKHPRGGTYQIEFQDPASTGNRLRLRGKIPAGPVYLYYEAERLADSAVKDRVLQSDYETKWNAHKNADTTHRDEEVAIQ